MTATLLHQALQLIQKPQVYLYPVIILCWCDGACGKYFPFGFAYPSMDTYTTRYTRCHNNCLHEVYSIATFRLSKYTLNPLFSFCAHRLLRTMSKCRDAQRQHVTKILPVVSISLGEPCGSGKDILDKKKTEKMTTLCCRKSHCLLYSGLWFVATKLISIHLRF